MKNIAIIAKLKKNLSNEIAQIHILQEIMLGSHRAEYDRHLRLADEEDIIELCRNGCKEAGFPISTFHQKFIAVLAACASVRLVSLR